MLPYGYSSSKCFWPPWLLSSMVKFLPELMIYMFPRHKIEMSTRAIREEENEKKLSQQNIPRWRRWRPSFELVNPLFVIVISPPKVRIMLFSTCTVLLYIGISRVWALTNVRRLKNMLYPNGHSRHCWFEVFIICPKYHRFAMFF